MNGRWAALALAACGGAEEPEVAAIELSAGDWEFSFARRYGGDCALDDMSTGRTTEVWHIEPEPHGFSVVDDDGFLLFCGMDGAGFLCDVGTVHVLYITDVGDVTESVSTTIYGTVMDPTHLSGTYAIAADCSGGEGCTDVGLGYGAEFSYPCTAEAGVEATLP